MIYIHVYICIIWVFFVQFNNKILQRISIFVNEFSLLSFVSLDLPCKKCMEIIKIKRKIILLNDIFSFNKILFALFLIIFFHTFVTRCIFGRSFYKLFSDVKAFLNTKSYKIISLTTCFWVYQCLSLLY